MQLLGVGPASRFATWSANMTSNSRNVKLPFLSTRCHYQGVDLPLDLPLWQLIVEMLYCHSWPLDATTRGVDLPADLQIWPLTVEMWNCHSWPLDATTWGIDLPLDLPLWVNMSSNSRNVISPFLTTRCQYWGVDLPLDLQIWPLTVEMWNCHSWPLDATTGGWTCQ